MARLLPILIIISGLYTPLAFSKKNCDSKIIFEIPGLSDQTIVVGFYYGKKTLLLDSIQLDPNGFAEFKSFTHSGLYFIIFPSGDNHELMIDCKDSIPVYYKISNGKTFVLKNPTAKAYDEFLQFTSSMENRIDSLKAIRKSSSLVSDKKNVQLLINAEIAKRKEMQEKLAEKFNNKLLGNYFLAQTEIKIHPVIIPDHVSNPDSFRMKYNLEYYQSHYLDNICMNDPGLIYTPVLEDKILYFFERIIDQKPGRKAENLSLILKRISNEEVYQFICNLLFEWYASDSGNPENEYLYLYLISKYYLNGKVPWVSNQDLKAISEIFNRKYPVSLFQVAPEIDLPDKNNISQSLKILDNNFVLIIFWDYSCEHCRRVLKDIIDVWRKYSDIDMQVYTVYTGDDLSIWNAFLAKKIPKTWINTHTLNSKDILAKYTITRLPETYLLNNRKVIIDKSFTAVELDEFLQEIQRK